MIKNVVFDIGNVIWRGRSDIVLDKISLSKQEKEDIKNTFFENTIPLDMGTETLEEHFCKYPCSLCSNEKVRDFLLNYFRYRDFNLNVIEIIHKLKENGYNVYILSNNNKEAIEYLKQAPELKCVDGWVVSCYYSAMKPEKEIYEILFNTFNIKPDECLFIDDSEKNINTGKVLGMDGYVFKDDEDGIKKLISYMKMRSINV